MYDREEDEEALVKQLRNRDTEMQVSAKLKRGVRTFGEVAHFVRLIETIPEGAKSNKISEEVWITPSALLEMRQGRQKDKALLMYCMMKGVSQENAKEANEEFRRIVKQECNKTKMNKKIQRLLNIDREERRQTKRMLAKPDSESETSSDESAESSRS
jgi:hypothetical protein